MRWPTSLIVGGIRRDRITGEILHAEALESILRTAGPADLTERVSGLSENRACELTNRWIDKLPLIVEDLNHERLRGTGIQHYVLTSNSFDNFLARFQQASPGLVIVRVQSDFAVDALLEPVWT